VMLITSIHSFFSSSMLAQCLCLWMKFQSSPSRAFPSCSS
jgi:hypothetical protein